MIQIREFRCWSGLQKKERPVTMTIHAVHSTLRVAARAQHDHWQEGLGIVKRVGTVRRDRCSEVLKTRLRFKQPS